MSSRVIRSIIERYADQAGLRTDAGETALFVRDLEQIDVELYNAEFPDIMGRSMVALKGGLNPAIDSYTWRGYTFMGESDETDDYSDDAPGVEIEGSEITSHFTAIRQGYGYSVMDLRRAQMAGLSLDSEKARLARELMERKLDKMIAVGSKNRTANGIYGFYNQPGYPTALDVTAIHNGAGPSGGRFASSDGTTWDLTSATHGKTPQQMADDLNKARSNIRLGSLGVHDADTVTVDLKTDTLVNSTNMHVADGTTYSSTSVYKYLRETCSWIKNWRVWANRGDTATTGEAGGAPLIVVHENKPRNQQLLLPQDFEQFPPQLKGLTFGIDCHMRCGGVITRYPNAFQVLKKPYGV